MKHRSVGVIGTGEMGSAVAKRLADGGCAVRVSLAGRGAASRRRIADLGVPTAESIGDAIAGASLVLSIVPPGQAGAAAGGFCAALRAAAQSAVFVDCNAIAPQTARAIAAHVASAGGGFVDGGIIGGPPRPGEPGPILFVSGEQAGEVLDLCDAGLDVRSLGVAVGTASALKMSYAGVTKGLTALCALMQRHARANGIGADLDAVLSETRPDLWNFLERAVPGMPPKAYRWVAEMREIAAYAAADEAAELIYEGLARFYERIAAGS
jgi:3-hydroxyisobutyrate dehydrogenase-like beta-hydroxyacid dehydrogenase